MTELSVIWHCHNNFRLAYVRHPCWMKFYFRYHCYSIYDRSLKNAFSHCTNKSNSFFIFIEHLFIRLVYVLCPSFSFFVIKNSKKEIEILFVFLNLFDNLWFHKLFKLLIFWRHWNQFRFLLLNFFIICWLLIGFISLFHN